MTDRNPEDTGDHTGESSGENADEHSLDHSLDHSGEYTGDHSVEHPGDGRPGEQADEYATMDEREPKRERDGERNGDHAHDPGDPEGPSDAQARRRLTPGMWVPVATAVGLAVGVGMFGGQAVAPMFAGLFGEPEEIPLEDAGNVERRSQRLAGEPPDLPQAPPQDTPRSEPAEPAGQATVTRETVPDKRAEERKTLAFDSPLTPPAMKLAEAIRNRRGAREKAVAPDPDSRTTAQTGDNSQSHAQNSTAPGFHAQGRPGPETHVLARGSVIPAVLRSAIDSALPGLVRAQVSRDVYDSLTGNHVLIPKGTSLVGTYGRGRQTSDERMFVSWSEVRLPDGTPVDFPQFAALGPDGATGVKGRRSTGFLEALGATILFNLAGNATSILTTFTKKKDERQQQSGLASLLGGALGNSTQNLASDYIGSLLKQRTRFRVAAGTFLNVVVEQDLSLPDAGTVKSGHTRSLNVNRLRERTTHARRRHEAPAHDR